MKNIYAVGYDSPKPKNTTIYTNFYLTKSILTDRNFKNICTCLSARKDVNEENIHSGITKTE